MINCLLTCEISTVGLGYKDPPFNKCDSDAHGNALAALRNIRRHFT